MSPFAESHVEEAALGWLAELGYATANGLDIGPDGTKPERANYGDVLLVERVRAAIAKLNPKLKAEARTEVLAKLTQTQTPALVEENRRLHRFMVEGVPIEVRRSDGSIWGRTSPVDRLRRSGSKRLARREPVHGDRAQGEPAT